MSAEITGRTIVADLDALAAAGKVDPLVPRHVEQGLAAIADEIGNLRAWVKEFRDESGSTVIRLDDVLELIDPNPSAPVRG